MRTVDDAASLPIRWSQPAFRAGSTQMLASHAPEIVSANQHGVSFPNLAAALQPPAVKSSVQFG